MTMVEQDLKPLPKRQKLHEPSILNEPDADDDITDTNETDVE
jgi:hypothetical protein